MKTKEKAPLPWILQLIFSLALPLLVGGAGGWATAQTVQDWYPSLLKPAFNPPSWVFGPVWTLLYLMMGLAFFLVWRRVRVSPTAPRAMVFFGVQLFLNLLWSFLFFWARSPGWAFLEILILLVVLSLTTRLFFREHRLSGWLMTPYLAWVTFAMILNGSIWFLNR
jgi:tryptophan-rich sensory protein